jgi:hypothetical protein
MSTNRERQWIPSSNACAIPASCNGQRTTDNRQQSIAHRIQRASAWILWHLWHPCGIYGPSLSELTACMYRPRTLFRGSSFLATIDSNARAHGFYGNLWRRCGIYGPRRGQNISAQGDALRERENPTTEANGDENMVIIHNEEPVALASNPGLDSPLDKRDNLPCGAHGCPVNTRFGFPETQRPTAPSEHMNKRSEGEKSATFGHFRPRSDDLPDRSVPFSSRYAIGRYVIARAIGAIQKAGGRLARRSDVA